MSKTGRIRGLVVARIRELAARGEVTTRDIPKSSCSMLGQLERRGELKMIERWRDGIGGYPARYTRA